MPRRKTDNKYKKALDGRNHNGQKKGDKQLRAIQKELKAIDTSNRAKKERTIAEATKGVVDVYGSKQDLWRHIAEQSKESFNHLKLLLEYMEGKPTDGMASSAPVNTDVPIINFFSGTQPKETENTIDITPEEDNDDN